MGGYLDSVVVDLVEDLSDVGDGLGAGPTRPLAAVLEARPDVQLMDVGAPPTHRANDCLVGSSGEEGRRTSNSVRVRAELQIVLADAAHEIASHHKHRVRAQRLVRRRRAEEGNFGVP